MVPVELPPPEVEPLDEPPEVLPLELLLELEELELLLELEPLFVEVVVPPEPFFTLTITVGAGVGSAVT